MRTITGAEKSKWNELPASNRRLIGGHEDLLTLRGYGRNGKVDIATLRAMHQCMINYNQGKQGFCNWRCSYAYTWIMSTLGLNLSGLPLRIDGITGREDGAGWLDGNTDF